MLVRARDRGPGCCAAKATVAARWRPAVRSGRVAVRGKLQREGKVRWRRVGRDAWVASASRRWLGGGPERRAALPSGGGREAVQAGWLEEGENGLKHNFKNSRDPTVNQQ